jgi:hypothetical protein
MKSMIVAVLILGAWGGPSQAFSEQEAINLAKKILSEELCVSASQIELQEVESVQWPDSSLGCAQPGMAYTQIVTPGHRVLLRVENRAYPVHVGGGRAVVCGLFKADRRSMREYVFEELEPRTIPEPSEQDSKKLVIEAKQDLARRLAVEADRVDLVDIEKVQWPDSSLGCPRPGAAYTQVPQAGFLIRLRAGKHTYDYHSGAGGLPFLCDRWDKQEKR